MPKFPEPPPVEALAAVPPDVRLLPEGTLLWRIYRQGGEHPSLWNALRRFGPTDARFDHHDPPPRLQERGVIYVALDAKTCLAEVFQTTRVIDPVRGRPALVAFRTTRSLSLLDLMGNWPTRAGASMARCTGSRRRAQRWSLAAWRAYPDIEGILYGSSMDANRPQAVLYERAVPLFPASPEFHRRLDDPVLRTTLDRAAADLGYRLR